MFHAFADWVYRREAIIYWLLVAAMLTPIWLPKILATIDGPAHLAIAHYWQVLSTSSAVQLREYFQLKLDPDPNLSTYIILRFLLLFFSGFTAEKLLLSGYVLLFAAAGRYAAHRLCRETKYYAFFFLLIIYNFCFEFGFFNFLLGIPLCLIGITYWISTKENPRRLHFVGYLAISLLCYFTHFASFSALVAAILFYEIQGLFSLLRNRRENQGPNWKNIFQTWMLGWLPIFLAFLPAAILALWFVFFGMEDRDGAAPLLQNIAGTDIVDRVRLIAAGSAFATLHENSFIYSKAILILALLALLPWRTPLCRASKNFNPYTLTFLFFLLFDLFLLDQIIVRWMFERMQIYLFLFFFFWRLGFAPRIYPEYRSVLAVCVIAPVILFFLANLPQRARQHMVSGDYLAEFVAIGKYMEPHKTVLGLRIQARSRENRVFPSYNPFLQAASYFSLSRSSIGLKNIQVASGVTPIIYKRGLNPFRYLASDRELVENPPKFDHARFKKHTGKQLDYVVLWSNPDFLKPGAHAGEFIKTLEKDFELIAVSKGR